MRGSGFAAVAALATTVMAADLPAIDIVGSKFFYSNNGSQFFIKGVAYQQDYSGNGTVSSSSQTYSDPLSDTASCERDVPYLQQLETNTIRVYAVNPDLDHSGCMAALQAADIYVIADLAAPVTSESISRSDPAWTTDLYARYTSVVDALQNYTNVIGFFAGNEVSNMPNNTDASAFVKAAVRDTKAYIKAQNYRSIGVGYATSDDQYIRQDIGEYFNCGDQDDAIDFLGYNIYSWCGASSYEESGYAARTAEFANYSVPVFFAEYGCNSVEPRLFDEVLALYGSNMTPVWSGGIVYMYFEETNNYGLVTVSGTTVSTLTDFDNLSTQIAKVSPSSTASSAYSPSNSPAACPTEFVNWTAVATPLPPSPNLDLCDCMYETLACVVSSGANEDGYGDLFDYVCGQKPAACDGIAANSTSGDYGAYGMCNSTLQLAYVFNNYYADEGSSSSACDFAGNATVKAATTKATGTCSSLLAQAGTAGTGTVTASPSAASAASSSKSKGAASPHVSAPHMVSGLLPVALLTALALVSGVGMLVL